MNAVWNDHGSLTVDLGDDPPLVTADNRSGPPDRRRVSLRWLAGTILAAAASTTLMGGALYAALDGRQTLLTPGLGTASISGEGGTDLPGDLVEKGDRLDVADAEAPTRQILRVSTISRASDRDLIRQRPFARVSAPLVAETAAIVDAIPTYNPLRIFADANVDQSDALEDTLYGADVDGAMTMKVVDFPVDNAAMEAVATLDVAGTEQIVRESAQFLDGTSVQLAALPLAEQSRFDFGFADRSAFEQYGVRIVPENVSFVATTAAEPAPAGDVFAEEKVITVPDGGQFEQLLTDNEATDEEAGDIALAFRRGFSLRRPKAGDKLRIALQPDPTIETERYRPVRVALIRGDETLGTVGLSDKGGYVAVEDGAAETLDPLAPAAPTSDGPRPRLYESLYQTALANQMSPDLIDELVRIYSFDLDFNTRIQPGDRIEVVYSLGEDETESAETSEIVYTAITAGGKERRYYRYKAPDDGSIDYYDAEGKSAKKFLLRKPMSGGTFRSGFGSRRHPLLGYVRAHTGVDWSAPRGTPIMSAGDGTVIYADWKSGYGNYIEVQHTNGYTTAYAHQTGFAKGIRKGARVRQGQVIGYVGSTGLSTGPHLHYEVHVNDNPVDPMRIKLPRGRSLEGDVLASFEGERERIDTLLGGRPGKVAAVEGTSGG